MKNPNNIEHVSDTSLWVAVHRGAEGKRSDALFKDPLAFKLAGDRGLEIAKQMAFSEFMEWMMAMRTIGIDQLIQYAIEQGVDTIVNLGAGLDTRPYRLDFRKPVKWIEVDFPGIIALKNSKLADDTPVVPLHRISLDLTNRKATQDFLRSTGKESRNIAVITEGVIPYLSDDEAANLATDLSQIVEIKYWIQDYRIGGFTSRIPSWWLKRRMKASPFKFSQSDWFGFFASHGWKLNRDIKLADEAERVGRAFPKNLPGPKFLNFLISDAARKNLRNATGVAILEKAEPHQMIPSPKPA